MQSRNHRATHRTLLAALSLSLALGVTACASGPSASPGLARIEQRLASPEVLAAEAANPGYLDNANLNLSMARQAYAADQPAAGAAYVQQAERLVDDLLRQKQRTARADPDAARRVAEARDIQARSAVSAARSGLGGLQVLSRGAPEDAERDARVEAARQATGRAEVALLDGEPDAAIAEAASALQLIERLRAELTVPAPEADPTAALQAALTELPGAKADLSADGLSVRFGEVFADRTADPSAQGAAILAQLGDVASRFSGWQIEVVTRAQVKDADPTGQLILAQQRAAAVRTALAQKGVSQGRMTGAGGFGEGDPAAVMLVFRPLTANR